MINNTLRSFCTVINNDYISLAWTLYSSLKQHHEEKLFVLAIDFSVEPNVEIPGLQFICPQELGINQNIIDEMFAYHDVVEVATLFKPFLIDYLISMKFDFVTYLDPDVMVLDEIPITCGSAEQGVIGSLTPHRITVNKESTKLEVDFLRYGVFNLGFIELNGNAKSFLDWWKARVLFNCTRYNNSPYFTDQKWIDLAISFFNFAIIRDLSFNIAPWNYDERELEYKSGAYYSGIDKVKFIHFSQGSRHYLVEEQAPVWRDNPMKTQTDLEIIESAERLYLSTLKQSKDSISRLLFSKSNQPTRRGELYRFFYRIKIEDSKVVSWRYRLFLRCLIPLDLMRLQSVLGLIKGLQIDLSRIGEKIKRNVG